MQLKSQCYSSAQIRKVKQNSKKYHQLLKQFLSHFKVHLCNDQSNHQTQYCFYYHDENDRRRNPYSHHELLYNNYKMCNCGHLDCADSHNHFEHVYHPLSYKINPCPQQADCDAGFYCPLSHPDDFFHFEFGEFFRFDLRTFKTIKCINKHPHQRKTCLYFHNDKDKRRPPNIKYNHFLCNKQKCHYDLCECSHNKLQQLYHPNRYKTKFCQFYPKNIDKCDYKSFCSFAHTQNQIIEDIQLLHLLDKTNDFYLFKYKTIWCPFTQNHERDKCPYAHNIQDYRRNPIQYDYQPVRCQFWNFSDEIKSIDGAGCKLGMECRKCHGWMEQRYHPLKYNSKRSRSVKKEGFQAAEIIVSKKLTYLNSNDFKAKGKGNTNPQILKSNYSKGTPFFKNDKSSEYSAKTKAKSNNIQSDKSNDGSSNKEVQKVKDDKIILPPMGTMFSYVYGENNQKDGIWALTDGRLMNDQQHHNKEENSARSKSAQKSEEYAATYSNSMKSVVDDKELLQKLRSEKMNGIQIAGMDRKKIDGLSFLSAQQKNLLAIKLQIYSMKQSNSVSYSKQLTRYFISKKKQGILQKMQQKRVKQARLLKLLPKQIIQFSFLDSEEKAALPKLLKEYRNEKEFKELNTRIEEETKMK